MSVEKQQGWNKRASICFFICLGIALIAGAYVAWMHLYSLPLALQLENKVLTNALEDNSRPLVVSISDGARTIQTRMFRYTLLDVRTIHHPFLAGNIFGIWPVQSAVDVVLIKLAVEKIDPEDSSGISPAHGFLSVDHEKKKGARIPLNYVYPLKTLGLNFDNDVKALRYGEKVEGYFAYDITQTRASAGERLNYTIMDLPSGKGDQKLIMFGGAWTLAQF